MGKRCIRLRFRFILEPPARCAAMLLIISLPFPANRMSRSWKARRSSATSSRDVCRAARRFSIGSSAMRRNPDSRRIYILSNRHSARQAAANFLAATARRARPDEWEPANTMIGEGIQSSNQRKHTYVHDHVEVGFFTDPSVCIGCKACEVACKEWNHVPDDGFVWSGNSYDNTGHLGASTWRHVMFVEQDRQKGNQIVGSHSLGTDDEEDPFRWIFLSDVCKHCEEAGCLEACPTGAIVRTEVCSVLVQNDVCNGCGYCVVSCPFGVIDRRPEPLPDAGGAFKCTFCYDRQKSGLVPV